MTGDRIFSPTDHIHDGEVHAEGDFDHTLYLQDPSSTPRSTRIRADHLLPFAQASIVPPTARRWGMRVGVALIGAAGLGWIIARRNKLKKHADAAS